MEGLVSIIITVYNAENTIEQALNSTINQTYKNLDIIVINDNSTDGSLGKITPYLKDSRVKLVNNPVNLGAGLSRRIGIENSIGSYTLFLDSDDYLDAEYIETMLNYATELEADIVSPGLHITNEKGTLMYSKVPKSLAIHEGVDKFMPDEADVKRFLNGNLTKSTLWKEVEYSDRRYLEDTPTLFKLTYYANKVAVVPYAGMYYRQISTSLCHTSSDLKDLIFRCLAYKDNYEFARSKGMKGVISLEYIISLLKEIKDMLPSEEVKKYPQEMTELFTWFLTKIDI